MWHWVPELDVTAEALQCVSLRAGPCCPGYRGWRQRGSSWRSPAGLLTRLSSTPWQNTVSSYPYSVILCVLLFKHTATLLTVLSPLPAHFISHSFHISYHLSVSFHLVWSFIWSLSSLSLSPFLDAEVHYVNMTALTKGHLLSSFWVVDRRHFYIGSASMDWRSLATVSNIYHSTHKNTHRHPFTWIGLYRGCGTDWWHSEVTLY